MAQRMQVGDTVELKVGCYSGGQSSINVLHYAVVSAEGVGAEDAVFAADMDAVLAPKYKNLMGNDASYYGVSAQVLRGAQRFLPAISATAIGVGAIAGGALPGQVCGLLTKQTRLSGRRFRGRVYIPFPGMGMNDPVTNLPVVGYKTLLDVLGTSLALNRTVGDVGVETLLVPILRNPPGITGTVITGFLSRVRWATQRRRGSYGRPNAYPPF